MNLKEQFYQAVDSNTLPNRPKDLTLLKCYSLYKQATDGGVHGNFPDRREGREGARAGARPVPESSFPALILRIDVSVAAP